MNKRKNGLTKLWKCVNKENASKLWKIIQEAGDYLSRQRYSLVHSSYADHLQFIKNKPHKDSLKTPLKLGNKLGKKEINQISNLRLKP